MGEKTATAMKALPSGNTARCLVCDSHGLEEVCEFGKLPRITSDCRPFPSGGRLSVCPTCQAVQKFPDSTWNGEIAEIYKEYAAYSVAGGEEQIVFDIRTGTPSRRSDVLMGRLAALFPVASGLRILDVGCGHGVTLAAMSRYFPNSVLAGHELGTGNLARLEKIAGFDRLFTGGLAALPDSFDLISMVHSLEHFTDPFGTLDMLRSKLTEGGHLFIEVCNVEENPFDMLVADHLLHFSPSSLETIVRRAGFSPIRISTDWVKKEISLLARRGEEAGAPVPLAPGSDGSARIRQDIDWLFGLVSKLRYVAENSRKLGVFGTSIAATWIATAIGDRIDFFVDEDPHRIGKEFMGKPVLSPDKVEAGAMVFLALAPTLAESIRKRLSGLPLELVAA